MGTLEKYPQEIQWCGVCQTYRWQVLIFTPGGRRVWQCLACSAQQPQEGRSEA